MTLHNPATRRLILVVEDDADSLSAVVDALEAASLSALVARDGASAIALLDRVRPDLVLMDAMMPGLDGFETCRQLKSHPRNELTPVIFMTGLSDTEHVLEGLAAGGVDYVTKPVDLDALLARIDTHIANAGLIASARSALDASGPGVVALGASGRIVWMSDAAVAVCGASMSGLSEEEQAAVTQWVAKIAKMGASDAKPLSLSRSKVEQVSLRMIGRTGTNEILASVQTIETVSDAQALSKALELSPREGEVLAWVAYGKSNNDVAAILELSPRTITKHLEQVYRKLGVENRTSAATLALKVLL